MPRPPGRVSDSAATAQRSENMRRIRSSANATTELVVARQLRLQGITGWRRHSKLVPGLPDFLFLDRRVALFVDGCFWHGCASCYVAPKANAGYWKQKRTRNRLRDMRVRNALRRNGYSVIQVWEHAVAKGTWIKRLTRSLERNAAGKSRIAREGR